MEPLVSLDELEYISGPVSLYYFQYGGRDFYFFGDIHNDRAFTCPQMDPRLQCSNIEPNFKSDHSSDQCFDIIYLLKAIFERAKQQAIYTDFFLESFFKDDTEQHSLDQFASDLQSLSEEQHRLILSERARSLYAIYNELDYIGRIYIIFNPCFQKVKYLCPYAPYARFHYADIRSIKSGTTVKSIFPDMLVDEYLKPLIKLINETSITSIETSLTPIERGTIIQYSNIFNWVITSPIDVLGSIFNAYLLSNDFPHAIDDIFITFPYPKMSQLREQLKSNVMERNGHQIHRVKAQLDGLRDDEVTHGGVNMADLILAYAQDRYRMLHLDKMYRSWHNYYYGYYLPIYEARGHLQKVNVGQSINDLMDSLVRLGVIIMDVYILARMFRTFRHSRKIRFGEIDVHHVSSTVLTYTGRYHTDGYALFFAKYLGLAPTYAIPNKPVPEDIRESLREQYRIAHPEHEVTSKSQRCLHDPNLKTIFRSQ